MPVHDLFFSVARITTADPESESTGFFYRHNAGDVYLVTNRHCVIDEDDDFKPTEISVLVHKSGVELWDVENETISLYDSNGLPIWLEHSDGTHVDVVLIPCQFLFEKQYVIKALQEHNFLPPNIPLSPGEDLVVIGFPLGFFDAINNLPVVRNAALASAHNIAFNQNPHFLVDARLHSGSSGSPVWTKPRDQLCTTDGAVRMGTAGPGGYYFFTGVFSAAYDPPRDKIEDEPLGLNKVWFARLLPEIIAGTNQ